MKSCREVLGQQGIFILIQSRGLATLWCWKMRCLQPSLSLLSYEPSPSSLCIETPPNPSESSRQVFRCSSLLFRNEWTHAKCLSPSLQRVAAPVTLRCTGLSTSRDPTPPAPGMSTEYQTSLNPIARKWSGSRALYSRRGLYLTKRAVMSPH